MNSIQGKISHIDVEGSFCLLHVNAGSAVFKSIIILSDTDFYHIEDLVHVHFKETEVSLATKKLREISLQNQIEGKIIKIEKDKLLCRITLDTEHGTVRSVITTDSATRMDLTEGQTVVALIKTNEIMISHA